MLRTPLLLGAVTALAAGCAAMATSIEGESHGRNLDLRVTGQVEAGHGAISVEVGNHTDDAVGIDLDAIRVVDRAGGSHEPLGRAQGFRTESGEASTRRVPYGSITVAPSGREEISLEFDGLPDGALTLAMPSLYRLGIDGQENLHAIRLPLHTGPATAARRHPATVAAATPSRPRSDDAPPRVERRSTSAGEAAPVDGGATDAFFDPFVEWY